MWQAEVSTDRTLATLSPIHWDEKRLRVDSVKTGLRFCPIFPELLPLLNAHAATCEESDFLQNRTVVDSGRSSESNLRIQLKRIVERAGLVMWAKPFVNLRGSCRTDLEDRFASHVVDAWLGHSTKVARKHYLQVTEEHWKRAITEPDPTTPASPGPTDGPTDGPIGVNPEQTDQHPELSQDTKRQQKRRSASLGCTTPDQKMPPLGLEPLRKNTVFAGSEFESTTESTTCAAMVGECIRDYLNDDQLAELLEQLQTRAS